MWREGNPEQTRDTIAADLWIFLWHSSLSNKLHVVTAKLRYNEHGYNKFMAISNNYLSPGKVFI